jgi:hypothetical protein
MNPTVKRRPEPYFVEGIATRIIKFGSGLVIEEDLK